MPPTVASPPTTPSFEEPEKTKSTVSVGINSITLSTPKAGVTVTDNRELTDYSLVNKNSDCDTNVKELKGSGNVITESRETKSFSSLELNSIIQIKFTQSDKFSLKIIAEDNVIPFIETRVKDKTLVVDICGVKDLKTKESIIVEITGPDLNKIESNGTGSISIEGPVQSEEIIIRNSGTGDIVFKQDVDSKNFEIVANGT